MLKKRKRPKRGTRGKSGYLVSRSAKREAPYDTGGHGRLLRGWNPGISGPNANVLYGAADMRDRSRDLTRKFPLLIGAYDTISSNIVGTGIRALSKARDAEIRRYITDVWEDWCHHCDVEGVNHLAAILDMAVRQRYEAGEVFLRFVPADPDDGLEVPLQIVMLEAEQVPYSKTEVLPNGNYIIAGVEFNAQGRRVAYHIYNHHPAEGTLRLDYLDTVRVEAAEVLHYFKPLRPGQVRGIPECFAAQVTARNLMVYDDAELLKKQNASLNMGFITSPSPDEILGASVAGGENDPDAGPGEAVLPMEAGTMLALNPGEDVKFNDPAESGSSYEPFRNGALRSIAASMSMTYEEFSLDFSKVNFSSIRAGLNQSQRKYRKEQQRLINMVCIPLRRRWFETAALAGVFNFPDYADNRRDYERVQFQPPGWAYVNPLQEVNAKAKEVEAGFKSREQIVAEMGYDVEEVDASIKRDQDRAEEMGLKLALTGGEADPMKELGEDIADISRAIKRFKHKMELKNAA